MINNIRITNQDVDPDYFDLVKRLYSNEKNYYTLLRDAKISCEFCVKERKIFSIGVLNEAGLLEGHCSIILNEKDKFFGFFECPNEKIFAVLESNLIDIARENNCNKLIGPINGSIWFPYRFMVDSDDRELFIGEMLCKKDYIQYFLQNKYSIVAMYHSGERMNFDPIMDATKDRYIALESMSNITFERYPNPDTGVLHQIYDFSNKVFSNSSVAYSSISPTYFDQLYDDEKLSLLHEAYLVKDKNKIIAFCTVFKEDSHTLIYKTIAVDPEYQKFGIGSALTYLVHKNAIESGFNHMIYALIRDENNIRNFSKEGANIFRTYSIVQINI